MPALAAGSATAGLPALTLSLALTVTLTLTLTLTVTLALTRILSPILTLTLTLALSVRTVSPQQLHADLDRAAAEALHAEVVDEAPAAQRAHRRLERRAGIEIS